MSERLSLWPPKRRRQQVEALVTRQIVEPALEREANFTRKADEVTASLAWFEASVNLLDGIVKGEIIIDPEGE
ncbi:MAG: hypothetical protein JWS12_263 [Candidatus Saccharibacteria bacterium]|nr:hypothetical protein [Candidatus Saccharibacteria bacterium]